MQFIRYLETEGMQHIFKR